MLTDRDAGAASVPVGSGVDRTDGSDGYSGFSHLFEPALLGFSSPLDGDSSAWSPQHAIFELGSGAHPQTRLEVHLLTNCGAEFV